MAIRRVFARSKKHPTVPDLNRRRWHKRRLFFRIGPGNYSLGQAPERISIYVIEGELWEPNGPTADFEEEDTGRSNARHRPKSGERWEPLVFQKGQHVYLECGPTTVLCICFYG